MFGCFAFTIAQKADSLTTSAFEVKYPYPVKYFSMQAEGQDLRMAYMDVKPDSNANGNTVMLFHGKNFGGYYWTNVIQALLERGYRVIVPDQIGFGKSSKPFIHYSFHQMAQWNKVLLDSLGIEKTSVLGHSMGGMLATRFALMYPDRVQKLLLENPIGLEDYKTFVPYTTAEEQYQKELNKSAESIKNYYRNSYFTFWKPEYNSLVDADASTINTADFPRFAKVAALTYIMIYEQPVLYEFQNLKVPTILFIGKQDKTIVGKGLLTEEQQSMHGQYRLLGKQIVAKIPNAKLVEFDGCGHIPHIEVPTEFLISILGSL